MPYVDGLQVAVRNDRREDYRKMAEDAAAVFKEHGALAVMEAWGDDVPDGKVTSFPMAVKLEEGETVVFSWIVWPSREARDAGNETVMKDPRMQGPDDVPFSMAAHRLRRLRADRRRLTGRGDASGRSAPAEPSRPGPEPGQRPTAPRVAAPRPPAVAPLPSSRVDAGFGTATPEVRPTASCRVLSRVQFRIGHCYGTD